MRVLDESNPAQFIKTPIFKAEIDPDVRFLGFDLTSSMVKGNPDPAADNPGWFFVIQERPGEPRFGLDDLSDESPATPTNWNELAWEHLAEFANPGLRRLRRATCRMTSAITRSRQPVQVGAQCARTWPTSCTRCRSWSPSTPRTCCR